MSQFAAVIRKSKSGSDVEPARLFENQ